MQRTRAQGAKLIEFGSDFQESREYAARLAAEQGLHMVQPLPSRHSQRSGELLDGSVHSFPTGPKFMADRNGLGHTQRAR